MRILALFLAAAIAHPNSFAQDSLARASSTAFIFSYDGSYFGSIGALYWAMPRVGISGQLAFNFTSEESPYGGSRWTTNRGISPTIGIQYIVYSYRVVDIAILGRISSEYQSSDYDYDDDANQRDLSTLSWRHKLGLGLSAHVALTDQLSISGQHTFSIYYAEARYIRNPRYLGVYQNPRTIYRQIAADRGELSLLVYF